jgi:hemolysin III
MVGFTNSHRSPLCESVAEERASMITHGIGALLSVVALGIMLAVSWGQPVRMWAAGIFGATLVLLYASSTFYHAFSNHRVKSVLQIVDHACIYLLIAGSYTPLTLVSLRGPWGWTLLGIIWFLALAGILLKSFMRSNHGAWWSTALYLLMGWLVVIAFGPVVRSLPVAGLLWLVAGGICYSFGVVFFVWRQLRYNHAIWHLFVLAGSACHVIATTLYILS